MWVYSSCELSARIRYERAIIRFLEKIIVDVDSSRYAARLKSLQAGGAQEVSGGSGTVGIANDTTPSIFFMDWRHSQSLQNSGLGQC
jgi:hypothetical protein